MFNKSRKIDKKGFTLVEVIVVAVIVAILAAVAIPLYIGYIRDSNQNAAQNAAGSAASYLGALKNAQCNNMPAATTYNAGETWSKTLPSGQVVDFTVPTGVTINVTATSVTAEKGGRSSTTYNY